MSGHRWHRRDYITYTCHIAASVKCQVSRTTHYSNEICDKLKTTHTSKNIPLHLILFFVQMNTISRVHSCIAKKYSDAWSHSFVFSIFIKIIIISKLIYCFIHTLFYY